MLLVILSVAFVSLGLSYVRSLVSERPACKLACITCSKLSVCIDICRLLHFSIKPQVEYCSWPCSSPSTKVLCPGTKFVNLVPAILFNVLHGGMGKQRKLKKKTSSDHTVRQSRARSGVASEVVPVLRELKQAMFRLVPMPKNRTWAPNLNRATASAD